MNQAQAAIAALKSQFREGHRDQALRNCVQACQVHPESAALHSLLGMMHTLNGNPGAAADAYLRAGQCAPRDPDIAFNLGVCRQQLGDVRAALDDFRRALDLRPGFFEALANLGQCAYQLGEHAAALDYLDRALALDPRAPQVADNLGLVHGALGAHQAALQRHEQALELAPDFAPAWTHRGIALGRLGRHAEALASHEQALRLAPGDASAWFERGQTCADLRQWADALAAYDRALAIDSGYAQAWSNRGVVLQALRRHPEALQSHERALAIDADAPQAWSNRGTVLHDLQRHAEALAAYDQALRLDPHHAEAWSNRGVTCHALRREAEALECCARALAADPAYADAHLNLAQYCLAAFDLARGWEEYAWRWQTPAFSSRRIVTSRPQWNGAADAGRLLLYGEQGIGDEILYAGMWDEIAARAAQVLVRTDPRLIPLLERSFPQLRFQSDREPLDETGFDCHLPMGSAGQYLRRSSADFAGRRHPYLRADAQRAAALREKLRDGGKRICGLSWHSSNALVGDLKSLPLRALLPILALPHLRFADLQYGDTAPERLALEQETGVRVTRLDEIDTYADIDGLAALIQACDLVVTTSNTTAHLAGALGKETWLLLPYSSGKFWYWHTLDGASPWHPSMRIFQQSAIADWRTPVAAVAQALTQRKQN